MNPYLNETDKKILELLYTYHFGWAADIAALIEVSNQMASRRLKYLLEETRFIQKKVLPGDRNKGVYGLTQEGFRFLKDTHGFPEQHIEDRDIRFDVLSDGYIRHECLVLHVAARFFQAGQEHGFLVYDRRSILSQLASKARQMRRSDRVKLLEVRPGEKGSEAPHRADDFLILKKPGERPRALFIEVDRATESLRNRHGKAKGKVSKMMRAYVEAYSSKFFKEYNGQEYKPVVLFVLETPWSGSTRLNNFIDLWIEIGEGRADDLPRFITLQEFDSIAIEGEHYQGTEGPAGVV